MTLPAILGGEPAFPERVPLVRPTIDDVPGLSKRLEAILESGMLTNAATVRELEERVADRVGVTHAVAVSNCTSGLMLVYQALGVGPGTRVLLPSFTFAASAHAVVWAGAEPDFVEVTRERCSLDVDDLDARLALDAPIAAISATHVYGHPAEVEAIAALTDRHEVPVVYDAAHALGSERRGTPIGGNGAAEVFSLSPTKVVVAGEGGIVTTDDSALADALRIGRDYGNPGDYDCRFPGLNARLSELHAAVALSSLDHLDEHIAHRNAMVETFAGAIAGVPGVRIVRPAEGDRSTWKDLTLVIDAAEFGLSAPQVQQALAAEGIDSRRYYDPPCHRQQAYRARLSDDRALDVTDELAASVVTPPLWSHLPDSAMRDIAAAIARFHDNAASIAAALGDETGPPGTIEIASQRQGGA